MTVPGAEGRGGVDEILDAAGADFDAAHEVGMSAARRMGRRLDTDGLRDPLQPYNAPPSQGLNARCRSRRVHRASLCGPEGACCSAAPSRGPAMPQPVTPQPPVALPTSVQQEADGEDVSARNPHPSSPMTKALVAPAHPSSRMSTALVGPAQNSRSHPYKDTSDFLG